MRKATVCGWGLEAVSVSVNGFAYAFRARHPSLAVIFCLKSLFLQIFYPSIHCRVTTLTCNMPDDPDRDDYLELPDWVPQVPPLLHRSATNAPLAVASSNDQHVSGPATLPSDSTNASHQSQPRNANRSSNGQESLLTQEEPVRRNVVEELAPTNRKVRYALKKRNHPKREGCLSHETRLGVFFGASMFS